MGTEPTLLSDRTDRRPLIGAFLTAYVVGYLPLILAPWTMDLLAARCSIGWAGTATSAELASCAVASMPVAAIATKYRRAIALCGLLLIAAGATTAFLTNSCGPQFLATRLFTGTGFGWSYATGLGVAAGSRNPTRMFSLLWLGFVAWQASVSMF